MLMSSRFRAFLVCTTYLILFDLFAPWSLLYYIYYKECFLCRCKKGYGTIEDITRNPWSKVGEVGNGERKGKRGDRRFTCLVLVWFFWSTIYKFFVTFFSMNYVIFIFSMSRFWEWWLILLFLWAIVSPYRSYQLSTIT